ncbi:YihY/virulence factor BrkB family protein [Geodermatophilus sp. TF02-6]|uniref:YihY/virulence factor BrkB family protein n=1 Tax=Geodermatophilus sp. TF02-6 TaxID=2250575 RepID=UPI000DEAA171|nr:YihY/virulence factor BrkB family protein [Geodermatophilus sp. TF02-6]RBY83561.1 YihY/virulence factor BrkB family protein [Geodermatophilus sp. TF02-6]
MSTVLPGGSPARAGSDPDGAGVPSGATAVPPPAAPPRLAGWPALLRVPLQVLGRTVAKAWHDRILGLSAEAAFWQILSVPPLLIGLLGSLGYLGTFIGEDSVAQIEDQLIRASTQALTPDVVDSLVQPTLNDILGSGRLDVMSVGFLLSLWAGSSGTATFMNTVVIAYDQRDVRGPIRTRLMALWLFVVGMVLAVLTLPLLVLGRGLLVSLLPADWQATATVLVNAVYSPLVLIGLGLALTSFYSVVLPRRLPWWRHLPGTVLAVAFFVVAAVGTRAYTADILTATLPYGALATPIAALLFCFFFGMAVLLGAELNATIQERWPAPARRHQRRRQLRRAAKLERARTDMVGSPADTAAGSRPDPR